MKYGHRIARVLLFVFVALSISSISRAQDKTGLSVEPKQLNFGDHDIGSEKKLTLLVRNGSAAPENLAITMASGEQQSAGDANEFFWDSTCLNNLPPGAECGVVVSFRPMNMRKPEPRSAILDISNGGLAVASVPLSGSAFQNLGVSVVEIDYHSQAVNASSSSRSVVVTNYSDSTLPSLTVTVAGDVVESGFGVLRRGRDGKGKDDGPQGHK